MWNLYKLRTCVINVKTKRAIKNDQNFIWTISLLFYTDSRSHVSQKLWTILSQNVKMSNLKKIVDTKKPYFFKHFMSVMVSSIRYKLRSNRVQPVDAQCPPAEWMTSLLDSEILHWWWLLGERPRPFTGGKSH